MEKNIRVFNDTLVNVVGDVGKGRNRIPQFQREYVWERTKVAELFDSIYKLYPIGTFFLWKAGREYNNLFRHAIDLDLPPVQKDDDISFILDGQQRLTSLYVTLNGLTVKGIDFSRICFDVQTEKFSYRLPDGQRHISVAHIWGPEALMLSENIPSEHKAAFHRCYTVLRTYPLSMVEVKGQDLPSVCGIFQRINQAGKRLGRFDLISAMTFSPDFDLREKVKKDVNAPLKASGFGAISPAIITQLMALVKKGACTEKVEFSLTADEIKEMWKDVVASVLVAVDTLRQNMGVVKYDYIPYDAMLTLLSYHFAMSKQRALDDEQMKWVKQWFWRAAFASHYGSGGASKIGRDKELFDALRDGTYLPFEPAMKLNVAVLCGTQMTWSGSAVRNAFLCLLAQRSPLHWKNNGPLDLKGYEVSDFTSPEKHHIFPNAYLTDAGHGEVHALPNFCFLPAELNNHIRAKRPSIYFKALEESNENFKDALRTHLIPVEGDRGWDQDDYPAFLNARAELILKEVDRLTGLSSAPTDEDRHKWVEDLEVALRDYVHETLAEHHGSNYWKDIVPELIKTKVNERVMSEKAKAPDRPKDHQPSGRELLDYCVVPDYLSLIEQRNNWPLFKGKLGSLERFKHHLLGFSDYRNAVMHNRKLTEIERRTGELAVVYLETLLAKEEEPQLQVEELEAEA